MFKNKETCLPLCQVSFYTEAAPDARQIQCMSMGLIQLYHQKIGKKLNLLQLSFAAEDHQGSLEVEQIFKIIYMILDHNQLQLAMIISKSRQHPHVHS